MPHTIDGKDPKHDGVVYDESRKDVPETIDPDLDYEVEIKTAFEWAGSSVRPEHRIVMKGFDLTKALAKHGDNILGAKPA